MTAHTLPVVTGADGASPLCPWIRAKVAGPHGDPRAIAAQRRDASTVYWCLLSMGTVGPDDGLVHADLCTAARVCAVPAGGAAAV